MKKKMFLAATLMLICGAIWATMAFFTTEDSTVNIITSGNVKIAMVNSTPQSANTGKIMPGAKRPYVVQVENVGKNPAWIRVSVDFVLKDAQKNPLADNIVSADFDNVDWVNQGGYYYYTKAIQPGEKTTVLMTELEFDANMGNHLQATTVDVDVIAEAVQSQNNGTGALQAAGWN